MRYSKQIIDMAMLLYLKLDEQGEHMYSQRSIAKELNKKLTGKKKQLTHVTVFNWVKKYGWSDRLQSIKEQALIDAEKERMEEAEEDLDRRDHLDMNRYSIFKKFHKETVEINSIAKQVVKLKLQCTLAKAYGGKPMKKLVETYDFDHEKIKSLAYSDLELNRLYSKSSDVLNEHIKILASVSSEEEIKSAMIEDEDLNLQIESFNRLVLDVVPDLKSVLDVIERDSKMIEKGKKGK